MGSLWYKLQKLFPKLNLTEFGRYDTQVRLSPDEYKLAIWRYWQLKLPEDVEQLTTLMTEPIADKLKRHPNLYRPQADGFNFDASVDRINRLKTMLIRCTVYTSDIDFFDESGVSVQVVGGIDELTYKLTDLSTLIAGLQLPAPGPASSTATATDEQIQPGFDTYIKKQYRAELVSYLVKHYTNKKPSVIVPMLYALETLEVLTCKVDECDQTNLHNTLTTTFGDVGVRTSLNSALPLYHKESIDSTKRQKVEQHKQQIEDFLKNEQRQ